MLQQILKAWMPCKHEQALYRVREIRRRHIIAIDDSFKRKYYFYIPCYISGVTNNSRFSGSVIYMTLFRLTLTHNFYVDLYICDHTFVYLFNFNRLFSLLPIPSNYHFHWPKVLWNRMLLMFYSLTYIYFCSFV